MFNLSLGILVVDFITIMYPCSFSGIHMGVIGLRRRICYVVVCILR